MQLSYSKISFPLIAPPSSHFEKARTSISQTVKPRSLGGKWKGSLENIKRKEGSLLTPFPLH